MEQHNIDVNQGYGFFYFKKENLDTWITFFNQDKQRLVKKIKPNKKFRFFSDNNFVLDMEFGDLFVDSKFYYLVNFQENSVAFFTIKTL